MRRLDPSNPLDRPEIAKNVTALAVVAYSSVLIICTLVAIAAPSWPFRLLFAAVSVLACIQLGYQIWLYRAVRKDPALGASFEYKPRSVIRSGRQRYLWLACVGLLAPVGVERAVEFAGVTNTPAAVWGARVVLILAVLALLVAVVGLLWPEKRAGTDA